MRLLYLASALSSVPLALAWTTHIVSHSQGNDDASTLTTAFAKDPGLASNATILFEEGATYNLLTPIRFPHLENVVISVQGNLTYAADVQATQGANPITRRWCALRYLAFMPASNRWVLGTSCHSSPIFSNPLSTPFRVEFPRILVCAASRPQAGTSPAFPRFAFTGGSNVTLEGSTNPSWGWVNSHGQQVESKMLIASDRVLTGFHQWWDVMQELALQVNRPRGWGFQNITNGEIKDMKLLQVSVDGDCLCNG